ncbi:MAG: hypothetical protein AAFX06_14815 [Planctomycetota bacterium]
MKTSPFAVALLVLLFLPAPSPGDSKLDQRLKEALAKYPEADTNNDGVLTLEEAKAFRQKMRSRNGDARAKVSGEAPQELKPRTEDNPFVRTQGGRCLFLGHSFFIPVAKTFDELARSGDFPDHHAQFVMSGGGGGAPGRLWQSRKHREAATEILQSGAIDVLGMTYYDESNCRVEDYRRWIDLAVKHNPEIHIFIGLCWPDSPESSPNEFDRMLGTATTHVYKTVQTLRESHPHLSIQFVNYGKVASELKSNHAAGQVTEVTTLIGKTPDALFRDQKGHAGPLLLELAASIWLDQLYEADLENVELQRATSDTTTAIVEKVAEFNERFKQ